MSATMVQFLVFVLIYGYFSKFLAKKHTLLLFNHFSQYAVNYRIHPNTNSLPTFSCFPNEIFHELLAIWR